MYPKILYFSFVSTTVHNNGIPLVSLPPLVQIQMAVDELVAYVSKHLVAMIVTIFHTHTHDDVMSIRKSITVPVAHDLSRALGSREHLHRTHKLAGIQSSNTVVPTRSALPCKTSCIRGNLQLLRFDSQPSFKKWTDLQQDT